MVILIKYENPNDSIIEMPVQLACYGRITTSLAAAAEAIERVAHS